MTPDEQRYWAFISYSHSDQEWVRWLHRRLEHFSIPRSLRGVTGAGRTSFRPVFLDHAELAAGHSLEGAISEALDRSRFLIVVASPAAACSRRVNAEIEHFLKNHPRQRVLSVLIAGRPNAVARGYPPEDECLPAALRGSAHTTDAGVAADTPLGADARGGRGRQRVALRRIVAGLLGVGYDALYQRERRRLAARASFIAVGVALLVIALLIPGGELQRLSLRGQSTLARLLPSGTADGADGWIGTWQGTVSSSCGNYSGPVRFWITYLGPGTLHLVYNAGGMLSGSYDMEYFGHEAISKEIPGAAYFSLDHRGMTLRYPATCQSGTAFRSAP